MEASLQVCEQKRREIMQGEEQKDRFFSFKTLKCLRGKRSVHFDLWEMRQQVGQDRRNLRKPQSTSESIKDPARMCEGKKCRNVCPLQVPLGGKYLHSHLFKK